MPQTSEPDGILTAQSLEGHRLMVQWTFDVPTTEIQLQSQAFLFPDISCGFQIKMQKSSSSGKSCWGLYLVPTSVPKQDIMGSFCFYFHMIAPQLNTETTDTLHVDLSELPTDGGAVSYGWGYPHHCSEEFLKKCVNVDNSITMQAYFTAGTPAAHQRATVKSAALIRTPHSIPSSMVMSIFSEPIELQCNDKTWKRVHNAILDTGNELCTLVSPKTATALSLDTLPGEEIPSRCVHGESASQPRVSLTVRVQGHEFTVKAAVAHCLAVDALIGVDVIRELFELGYCIGKL